MFLGDDVFLLSPNLLKPYPGTQIKGSSQRIFNNRLSRSRRISENILGILSARFRVLRKPLLLIQLKLKKSLLLVFTCTIFLDVILILESHIHLPEHLILKIKIGRKTGDIILRSWRQEVRDQSNFVFISKKARNSSQEAQNIREKFTDYFLLPEDQEWQENY